MKLVKLQNLVAKLNVVKLGNRKGYTVYIKMETRSFSMKTVTLNEVIVDCQGVLLDRFGGKSNLLSDNYRFVA
jgi:hypothetical protein